MTRAGAPIPDVLVWLDRDDPGTRLPELAVIGPFLLLVYLWDWSGT